MNRGKNLPAGSWSRNSGYTIVETLIFLAVSGLLFVSAMLVVSGQQGKVEFRNAVRDFEFKLNDIAQNVGNGYYSNPGSIGCSANPTGQVNLAGTGNIGENRGCIFVGRVVQLGVSGDAERFSVYSAIGRQFKENTADMTEVSSLSETMPVLLAPGSVTHTTVPSASETAAFGGGVTVARVQYRIGAIDYEVGGFGFYTTLQSYNTGGSLNSGSARVQVVVPKSASATVPNLPTSVNQNSGLFVDQLDAVNDTNSVQNPDGGVRICLNSNGSRQYAWINIGGSTSGNLTVNSDILTGRCP